MSFWYGKKGKLACTWPSLWFIHVLDLLYELFMNLTFFIPELDFLYELFLYLISSLWIIHVLDLLYELFMLDYHDGHIAATDSTTYIRI